VKKLFIIPVAVVLVTALIFGGCARPAEEVPKEIRLGDVGSATGMYAGFGEGGVWGLRAAVDDINSLGGIYIEEYGKKLPVKLIYANSESDAAKVGTLAEDMVLRDDIHMFVSDCEPPPMRAPIAVIADKYRVPHLGGGPLEPWEAMRHAVTPPWPYTWASSFGIATPPPSGDPRYGMGGFTIVDTWMEWLDMFGDQTNKKAGIFASDDSDGIGWYALFGPSLEGAGYDVLGEERNLGLFPLDTTDYTPIINEWKDYDCEILWGNCPAPHFGTLWRQCHELGFKPKMVGAARAALFHSEVSAWGGDLPYGVGIEMWWHPDYNPEACPGIAGTTPMSLFERWFEETGQRLNPNTGWSYYYIQIVIDALERAGTLDSEAVLQAISETDIYTLNHRVKFDKDTQYNWVPIFFGQWYKTDNPWVWELPVVYSKHDFVPATADPIFPITYD